LIAGILIQDGLRLTVWFWLACIGACAAATIRGLIITEPYVAKNEEWVFAKFTHNDPSSSFYLKLEEVETVDG
jgi:hypothetical protein